MSDFLKIGTFFVRYDQILFVEEIRDGHIEITTKDGFFRTIHVVSQDFDTTEDKVEHDLSAPYHVTAKLGAVSYAKAREALLTKLREE